MKKLITFLLCSLSLHCFGGGLVNTSISPANSGSVLNDLDAVNFIRANSITSAQTQYDFTRFVTCLKSSNTWNNLIDGVILFSRFNPKNGYSIRGNPFTSTNFVQGTWGANFGGTNSITLNLPASCTSNTVVYVFRSPQNVGTDDYLVGLYNPNTVSGMWTHYNGGFAAEVWESGQNNVLPYSGNLNNNFNLIEPSFSSGLDYGTIARYAHQHKIWAVTSDGAGHRTFYWDTTQGSFYNNGGAPQLVFTSPTVCSDPMTVLQIGKAPNATIAGTFHPFVGEIGAVFVLSGTNTNNMIAVYGAITAYLEQDKKLYFVVADSRTAQDQPGTNSWPIDFSQYGASSTSMRCYAQGGMKAVQNVNYSTGPAAYIPSDSGIDKVFIDGLGINDVYADGDTVATLLGYTTNTMNNWAAAGCQCQYLAMWNLWSGATTPYTYSATKEGVRTNVNNYFYTNTFTATTNYAGIIPADQLFGQGIMNTVNGFSTDGLHFYGVNGYVANSALAKLIRGGFPTVFGYSHAGAAFPIGPFDAYGNIWLNPQTSASW